MLEQMHSGASNCYVNWYKDLLFVFVYVAPCCLGRAAIKFICQAIVALANC